MLAEIGAFPLLFAWKAARFPLPVADIPMVGKLEVQE